MENVTIPVLTGGINEVTRADVIEDHVLTECENYVVSGSGKLTVRPDTKSLSFAIPKEVADHDIKLVYAWIPKMYPKDHVIEKANYVLFVYGSIEHNTIEYRNLFMLKLIEDESGKYKWVSVVDNNNVPLATGIATPRITETEYGLCFVDGSDNNPAKFISITQEGEVRYGSIGIPAPLSLAVMSDSDGDNNYQPLESLDFGMDIPRGAILFMCYTCVTDDGIESNPSPVTVCDTKNFINRGEEYEVLDLWQKTVFNGIRTWYADIDNNSQGIDRIKYFNVYLSWTLYTEGVQARTEFRRVQRILIKDKLGDNSYTSTSPAIGQQLSYDNKHAPSGDDICYAGGVTFISNAVIKTYFPFPFDHVWKLTIANNNSRNYVQPVIRIRLNKSELLDNNSEPVIDDWDTQVNPTAPNNGLHHLRFYDSDTITPIPTYIESYYADYCDVIIKPPYMPANSLHNIYLCFGGPGVPEYVSGSGKTNFRTYEYGHWTVYNNTEHTLYNNRVRSDNVVILSEHNVPQESLTHKVLNRSNGNANLKLRDNAHDIFFNNFDELFSGTSHPYLREWLSYNKDNKMLIPRLWDDGYIETDKDILAGFPENLTWIFHIVMPNTSDVQLGHWKRVFGIYVSDGNYIFVDIKREADRFAFQVKRHTKKNSVKTDELFEYASIAYLRNDVLLFMVSRSSSSGKLTIKMRRYKNNGSTKEDYSKTFNDPVYRYEGNFTVKYHNSFLNNGLKYCHVFGIQLYRDMYIDDINIAEHLSLFKTYYPDEGIGYDSNENVNIAIERLKGSDIESKGGIINFSTLGGLTFPTTNSIKIESDVMRVMPAPNYLHNGEYLNTILIFGVNGQRKRLLLKGSPEGWVSQLNDLLMQEQTAYGLISRSAVIRIGETMYWLSPNGLLRENAEGITNLSMNRVNLPVWDDNNPTLSFNALLNYIFIHEGISYESSGFKEDSGQGIPDEPVRVLDWESDEGFEVKLGVEQQET